MSGASARRAPSRPDPAFLARAFRPGRLAAAFLLAAFSFALAPDASAQGLSAEDLWIEHVGTDTTAPRIVSVQRTGREGERTSASTLGFEVTFSEPVHVDPGDLEIARSPGSWRRVEKNIGPHYDEQDRLKDAGDPYYKPCAPDEERIYANLGTGAAWDLIERLDDECYRREQLSRHWHVLAGGGALVGTTYYEVDLVVAANHDMADVHGNRLDSTLPTGDAYQGYIIDRQGPSPRMTASATEHDGSTPFTVTVDFRAPVWGFRAGDMRFNSDRASVALTSGSDGASVYVLTVTPLNDTERLISLSLPRGVARDAAGNVNDRGGSVLVTPAPKAGVTFSTRALSVPEGGTATYTIVLDVQPSANVTIGASPGAGDTDIITSGVTSRTFTPANWSTPQEITLSALNDNDILNGVRTINHVISTTDTDYAALSLPSLTATEADKGTSATLSLSSSAYSFVENEFSGFITVTVNNAVSGGFTVQPTLTRTHRTQDVEVSAETNLGSLTFAGTAGENKTFQVHLVDDNVAELDETLDLTLSASLDSIDDSATATVTVTDNEAAPTLSVADASATEGGDLEFTVSLSGTYIGPVEVTATFTHGTAGAADYESAQQTITFASLATSRTLTVGTTADDTAEGDETFTVTLTADVDRIVDTNVTATGTIDNVPKPALSADVTTHDNSGAFTVTVDFGEAVNGFVVGDIGVTGGAKSNFTGSDGDSSYTVDVTPSGTADVVVSVAASVATDATSNDTLAADDLTVMYEAAVPEGCETDDLWCAQMTVVASTGLSGYCDGVSDLCGAVQFGSLDDDDFDVGTSTYQVRALNWGLPGSTFPAYLFFEPDGLPTATVYQQWTLHIGDQQQSFAGVTAGFGGVNNIFYFANFYAASSGRTRPTGTVLVRLTTSAATADTTLSALTLSGLTAGTVPLDQTFAAATTEYTASVPNDWSQVTVGATATAAGATVTIDPEDGDFTPDNGHQVGLSEGANTITVTVTNGTATRDYTITVTRAAAPQTLVSNIGQIHSSGGSFANFDHAQAFTTGDNAGGYTLTAVDVHFSGNGGDTSRISASVWSATAGGQPDTKQGDLTNPGTVATASAARYTSSGIELEASTTYIVVLDSTSSPLTVSNTDSDNEDAGAASGWSIGDGSLFRGYQSTTTTWSTFNQSKRIAIVGTAKAGAGGTEAPTDGLQARFGAQPAWHTGMPFWTELHFSAEPDIGYKDLRDKAFEVTGARVTRAQRIDKGSSLSWRLLVEPSGFGDVSISLPATLDCAAEGAVCTKEGAPLETGLALAVPGPGDRLAARLKGTSSHDGESFRLKLHFSQEPNLSYRNVRDSLFAVTGGRITRAQRLEKGSNLGWRLTVEPEGVGAVALELPATESCGGEGAVCTRDGRRLERGIAWTVAGPAAFSVSDAEANEDAGAALAFEVSLSRRLRAEARVDVATRDGTATAGSDYEAVTRTLVFAPGETLKTVEVPVLDDSHDEGSETMTLVLSNAQGAPIDDGEGLGTIVNSDAIPQAWLARFGRTVTGQVLDAVEERLTAPRRAGMRATLAGQALPSWGGKAAVTPGTGAAAANDNAATGDGVGGSIPTGTALTGADSGSELAALAALRDWMAHADSGADRFGSGAGFGIEGGERTRTVSGRELLLGTSFSLTAGSAEGGGHASLWGRVSVAGFDGREDALSLDGQVTTGLLGADWASEHWTAGLALGHSVGTGGYRNGDCEAGSERSSGCGGEIEAELTGLYPYAGLDLNERVSVWLAAGHGAGELTVIPDGQGAIATDMTMSMGATGTRIAVLKPEGEGLSLALKGDGRFTRTSSDAARAPDGGNLAAAEADVWLLRVGLEGSRPFPLGTGDDGASLTPSFELGVRRDGGDAETGFGADMGGGVALADPRHGLRLDLKGRALVAHEASGFREWGAGAAFGWDPAPSTDRGLAMSLTQSWGASPSGGMDGLLNRETLAGLAANDDGSGNFEASSRLTGEVGYGLAAFGGGFTGTPNLGFGMSSGGARDWRVGWRLTPAARLGLDFSVDLDAARRESASADAEHGVALRGTLRW